MEHGAIIALWKASVRSLGEEMKMKKIKMNWPLLDLSASPQVKKFSGIFFCRISTRF